MDRYWVGGTESWDGIAGTKWAATSNGPGGETVPTTADDVFFDSSSTGTVTIATGNGGAKSINCAGFAGTITGTANITVAGSVTLSSGMTYSHTGTITFTGTGTLTTAGKTFSGVTVDGTGITLALGDALNVGGRTITVSRGTFNTSSYSITCNTFNSSNTNNRAILFGSSTINISGSSSASFNITVSTNLTFNPGTSLVNLTANGGGLDASSVDFYDISYASVSTAARYISARSCNNLSISTGAGTNPLAIGGNLIVNGTLTCAGSSITSRGFLRTTVIGATCTITAAAISANDCDFRDIVLAGAAAGASPMRAGDCGGNSGIVFPAPKNAYRVGTNTTFAGTNSWSLTSGGSGSNDNFPLAQDTIIIDNGANPGSALTGSSSSYNLGSLDCSNRTNPITIQYSGSSTWHGSLAYGTAVTISGTSEQLFAGRGTMTFTSAGRTVTFRVTVDTPSGTFRLGDAFNSSNAIVHTRGTFDANNYNLTCTTFSSANSNTRTITMGSGLWTLSGANGTGSGTWNTDTFSNLTFNKNTANILLSDNSTTSRAFFGGGLAFNTVTIGGSTSTSTLHINGSSTFFALASTKTVPHTISLSTSQTTVNNWLVTGGAGNLVTVNSINTGVRRTFTLVNPTSNIDYLSVKDIGVTNPNRFYVGANSTDGGNNSNVIFTAAPSTGGGNMFLMF